MCRGCREPARGTRRTGAGDAENRLIEAGPGSATPEDDAVRVRFAYDYLGRRVRRTVDTRIGGDWVVTDDRKYIWDGWLQLAELDALDTESGGRARLLKTYVWGLDIAGQSGGGGSAGGGSAVGGSAGRDAAAGIGGLLAVYDTSGTTTGGDPTADDKMFYYCYDVNGNAGQLVDWRDAAVTPAGANWAASRVVAAYEYDPYGGIVSETGSYAASNRWRFSTREFDAVTGLGHWPVRVYEAKTGRWGSRDPIGESDHQNLFAFNSNSSIERADPLGLDGGSTTVPIPQKTSGKLMVWEVLMRYYTKHLGSCTGAIGVPIVVRLMETLRDHVDDVSWDPNANLGDAAGGYYPWSDNIEFGQGTDDSTVIHELTHALNDELGGYVGDPSPKNDEAYAWATQYLFEAINALHSAESAMSANGKCDEGAVRHAWRRGLSELGATLGGTYSYGDTNSGTITEAHLRHVQKRLFRISISCKQLADCLNKRLQLWGCRCIQLECAPTKRGGCNIGPDDALPEIFR